MKLNQILPFVNDTREIREITKDSSSAKRGDVYFCLSKDKHKSHEWCNQAKQNGAVVVSEFDTDIKVKDVRETFAYACRRFYGNACDDLKLIGITGTNGKTTTSHIVAEILKQNGKNVGVIGTNGVFYNDQKFECPLTTPDSDFLHKTFNEMKRAGVEYVVMEVSAHAIDQKRIDGIKFDVGVLTNITQDHLDYFESFDDYAKTKLKFISKRYVKVGVVCSDDKYAQALINSADVPILSYGLYNPCDTFAVNIDSSLNGTKFCGNVCDEIVDIKTNLIGEFNVYNSLAGLQVCQCFGLTGKELSQGLNFINPVEGRFNVMNFNGRHIIVDFAHTPDGIKNVLKTAKTLTDGKVCIIFGCGGNRDKSKRPLMGKIAQEYADCVCLTNDNPRFENPEGIIKDIEEGMEKPHFVELDRYTAIKNMINYASPNDIIVIAGKGAEKYQEIGEEKIPYSDFNAVYNYYKELDPNKHRPKECYDC